MNEWFNSPIGRSRRHLGIVEGVRWRRWKNPVLQPKYEFLSKTKLSRKWLKTGKARAMRPETLHWKWRSEARNENLAPFQHRKNEINKTTEREFTSWSVSFNFKSPFQTRCLFSFSKSWWRRAISRGNLIRRALAPMTDIRGIFLSTSVTESKLNVTGFYCHPSNMGTPPLALMKFKLPAHVLSSRVKRRNTSKTFASPSAEHRPE